MARALLDGERLGGHHRRVARPRTKDTLMAPSGLASPPSLADKPASRGLASISCDHG
jgi:hypothetical protein